MAQDDVVVFFFVLQISSCNQHFFSLAALLLQPHHSSIYGFRESCAILYINQRRLQTNLSLIQTIAELRWKKVTQKKLRIFSELERGKACLRDRRKNYFRVINLTLCVLFYHLISVHNLSLGAHKIKLTKKNRSFDSTSREILNENANENARREKCVKECKKFFLMMSSDDFVGRFRIACRRKPYN